MSDVPEFVRVFSRQITEKLTPTTDDTTENWCRYLACLDLARKLEKQAAQYEHAATESMD